MSVAFGFTSGVMCHYWYNLLDKIYPGKGIKIVFKKIISDQIIFSPFCIVACLAIACLINGTEKNRAYDEIIYKGKVNSK